MKKLILPVLLAFQASFLAGKCMASDCREAVVEAYESMESSIDAGSFSNAHFNDFNLTIEEFNELTTTEQEEIYIQVRPMKVMVDVTIIQLNNKISRYAGTFYEVYVLDKLELWRESVDNLRACIITQES